MMDIKKVLLQWFTNFFIKKTSGSGIKHENMTNQRSLDLATRELAEELHKLIIIWKFKKRKVYSTFIDNIWGADLADMQLLRKIKKGICFLLCVIDPFSKSALVIPLKDKKGITITNAFQKIIDKYNCKPKTNG